MSNAMPSIPNAAKQPKNNGGAIGTAFGVLGNVSTLTSLPGTIANATATTAKVKSDFKNAVKDNQYHDKFAQEKDDSAEKSKKKKDLAKYIPHLVGATLLTAAATRALQTGDITQPFQDVRDGFKRVPAQISNTFRKKSKSMVGKAAMQGATKGAADAIKATAGAPKPKINNSPLSQITIGALRSTGSIIPFMAGAAYIDHKVKDAELKAERLRQLQGIHKEQEPLPLSAAKAANTIAKRRRENDEMSKSASFDNFGGVDWRNNGKDMIVDEIRRSVPIALATAGAYGIIDHSIRQAKRKSIKSINDTIDDLEYKARKKRAAKKKEMEKSAEVLHPNDRTLTEKNVRKLIAAGTIAAATLPTFAVVDAIDRRLRRRDKRKAEERAAIERKYRALQRKREVGELENGKQRRSNAGYPRGSEAATPYQHHVSI